jgi:integrase
LLAALKETEFHVPAVLTIYAGLRRGELLALRWCDVGLDAAQNAHHPPLRRSAP